MKFYNLGHKTFETDFSYSLLERIEICRQVVQTHFRFFEFYKPLISPYNVCAEQ